MKNILSIILFLGIYATVGVAQSPYLFNYEQRERDPRPKPELLPNNAGVQHATSINQISLGNETAKGGWQTNGVVLCDTGGNAMPQIVSDGKSGAVICWQAGYQGGLSDSTHDIYAQWVDSAGYCRWQKQGVPVCSLSNSYSSYPAMVSDGRGGAIIAWEDWGRGGDYYTHIYAQRVDSLGNLLWGDNGLLVCGQWSGYVDICSDGQDGAIITWVDGRNIGTNYEDIYAQRIDSAGNPVWATDGVPVCEAESTQWWPHICSNNRGGAVITWEDDYRNNGTSGEDVYAQMLDSLGNAKWQVNGEQVCIKAGIQRNGYPISNSINGGIIGWWDFNPSFNLYLQNFDSSGIKQWMDTGVVGGRYTRIISDKYGGAIIGWADSVNKIDNTGLIKWGQGVELHPGVPSGGEYCLAEDYFGGVLVIWNNSNHLYAQRVDSSGVVLWNSSGVPVCVNMNTNNNQKVIGDLCGGVIATWYGDSSEGAYKIYAQRIYSDGTPGGVEGLPSINADYFKFNVFPTPFRNKVNIMYKASKSSYVHINIYNIMGQLVKKVFSGYTYPGDYNFVWNINDNNYNKVSSGIYLVQINDEKNKVTIKAIYLK